MLSPGAKIISSSFPVSPGLEASSSCAANKDRAVPTEQEFAASELFLGPSTNHIPDSPAQYITHDLQKGKATDFLLEGTGQKSQSVTGSLTSLGGFSVVGSKEDGVHLEGKYIRYKRIQQLDQYWEKLKEDPSVQKTAPKWMSVFNAWPVCLVVGIMICEDVELSMDATQTQEREGRGEVPVGQIVLASTGITPGNAADPQLAATSTKRTATVFKAKMGESSIFAVELRKISTGWLSRKLLQLKGTGPNVDGTRLAGVDSDSDEEEEPLITADDLVLEDLDPEDVRDLTA